MARNPVRIEGFSESGWLKYDVNEIKNENSVFDFLTDPVISANFSGAANRFLIQHLPRFCLKAAMNQFINTVLDDSFGLDWESDSIE